MYEPEYLKPLRSYLKAKELYRKGDTEGAGKALEETFGSENHNPFLRRNLDTILDEFTPAGSVLLDGVYGEMKCLQSTTDG